MSAFDKARDALLEAATAAAEFFGDVSGMGLSFTSEEQRILGALYEANESWQRAQCVAAGQVDPDDEPERPEPRVEKHGGGPLPYQTPPPPSRQRRWKKPRQKIRRGRGKR